MRAFPVCIAFFILDACLHLFFQSRRPADGIDHAPVVLTKILLVPTLYLSLFFLLPDAPLSLVYLAALCYTLGDFFLTQRWKGAFYIGVASFIAGHVLFSVYFVRMSFSILVFSIALALYLIPFLHYVKDLYNHRARPFAGFVVYGLVHYGFALCVAGSMSVPAILGTVLFCLSDWSIVNNMTGGKRKGDVEIMGEYILANVFLVLGVVYQWRLL